MAELVELSDPGAVAHPDAPRPTASGLELAYDPKTPSAEAAPEAKAAHRGGFFRLLDTAALGVVIGLTVTLLFRVVLQALWASDRSGFVAWVGRITFPLVPLRGALPDLLLFDAYRVETDTLLTVGVCLGLWMVLQHFLARLAHR